MVVVLNCQLLRFTTQELCQFLLEHQKLRNSLLVVLSDLMFLLGLVLHLEQECMTSKMECSLNMMEELSIS